MNAKIIQFSQLEELLTEPFTPDQVVRVMVLETSESLSRQIPDWRQICLGVDVRTINQAGHILACHPSATLRTSLPVATIQLYNGRRESDPTWQKYDVAWEQAAALKERIITYLQTAAVEKGFILRTAGVIDLGEIRPLHATWKTDPTLLAQNQSDVPSQ